MDREEQLKAITESMERCLSDVRRGFRQIKGSDWNKAENMLGKYRARMQALISKQKAILRTQSGGSDAFPTQSNKSHSPNWETRVLLKLEQKLTARIANFEEEGKDCDRLKIDLRKISAAIEAHNKSALDSNTYQSSNLVLDSNTLQSSKPVLDSNVLDSRTLLNLNSVESKPVLDSKTFQSTKLVLDSKPNQSSKPVVETFKSSKPVWTSGMFSSPAPFKHQRVASISPSELPSFAAVVSKISRTPVKDLNQNDEAKLLELISVTPSNYESTVSRILF